jgi:capsular polysaccharide biosynthesis protein
MIYNFLTAFVVCFIVSWGYFIINIKLDKIIKEMRNKK